MQVHSFDLMLELLVVNRTNETLQNVLIELSTQESPAKQVECLRAKLAWVGALLLLTLAIHS